MTSIYYSKARERAIQEIDDRRKGSWIIVTAPDDTELDTLAKNYKLDRDRLSDAVDIYEAPRMEVEDEGLYIYTRYCFPEGVEIATEPLLIIYTNDYIFTIIRAPQTGILKRMTTDIVDVVTTQKTKTLLQIFNEINRSYEVQLNSISRRLLRLRGQMRQSRLNTREFLSIIELEEDLNEFLSALQPQSLLYMALLNGKFLRLYEEDREMIEDLERGTTELIDLLRGRLRTLGNMREAYDAIATNNLNTIFKRLTSIAIFMTIPTIVAGLWGVNVTVPFQHSPGAFWILVAIIAVSTALSVWYFNHKRWL